MLGHASDACTSNRPLYTYMRDNGLRIGNLQVDVAEFFPCQSRQQLVEREMEYIRHYRPLFNVQVHTDQASILREQHAAHESARARFVGLLRAEKPEVVDYIFQLYLTNKSFRRMFIAVAVELHKSNVPHNMWLALEGPCPKFVDHVHVQKVSIIVERLCSLLGLANTLDIHTVFTVDTVSTSLHCSNEAMHHFCLALVNAE